MDRFLFAALFSISTTAPLMAQASVNKSWISNQFQSVPENQAHITLGAAPREEFNPSSIKVFVWNIKKTQEAGWSSEFTQWGKDRDLILVQEAFRVPVFENTINSFANFQWDMGISFLYKKNNGAATGTMIGSRVEPSEVVVRQTRDLEPFIKTPKATTFAKYPIEESDKEILVVNIHGINITDHESFDRHLDMIREEIVRHTGPVLLAGDFNTRTKARTSCLMKLAKELSLDEVDFKNGNQRMRFKFTQNYLDHGFVRGLKVVSAEVYGQSVGSDHKPMLLELAVIP